jgi:hypothetical protein
MESATVLGLIEVRRALAGLRRAVRRRVLVGGVAHTLTAAVAACCVSFAIDRGLDLDATGRLLLSTLLVTAVAVVAWRRLVRPLSTQLGDLALARLYERRHPELAGTLSSAIAFDESIARGKAPGDADASFLDHTIAAAAAHAVELGSLSRELLAPGVLGRRAAALVSVVALALTLAIAGGSATVIWLQRNLLLMSVEWPRPTTLELVGFEDGILRVAHGDPVVVQARASGVIPGRVDFDVRFADGGELRERALASDETGVFELRLDQLLVECELEATSAGALPVTGHMVIVPRPYVVELVATTVFPTYLDTPASTHDQPTTLELPVGTSLALRGRLDKPCRSGELVLGNERISLECDGSGGFAVEVRPVASAHAMLALVDDDGLSPADPPRLELQLTDDLPPDVDLSLLGVGSMVTPAARIAFEVEARDRHALSQVALQVSAGADEPGLLETRELGSELRIRRHVARGTVELAGLALEPGVRLALVAEASDHNDVTGPGVGRSERFELRVVTSRAMATAARARPGSTG